MRPHLVRINSTIVEQAPLIFNIILFAEITLCIVLLIGSPMFCIAAGRVGAIHRNFRCQICSASIIYCLGICARSVLIYYQIFDVPLTDDDSILLAADLLRDVVIGYYCGLSAAFCVQILIATVFWRWYERHDCSTFVVIMVTESSNITLAFINAVIWLLGYTPFIVNIVYLFTALCCSVSVMFHTFTKNARQLKSLSTIKISYRSYTVGRSYQIRENIFLMKARDFNYVVHVMVPCAFAASSCFICFAYNEYGPKEWILSRSIAYALWDLLFVIDRVCYLYREITQHPLILREFRNLGVVQVLRRKVIQTEEGSSTITKIEIAYTQTYFDQFKEAWT